MTTNRKLMKSTGVIGLATMSSRVFGFLRDVLFAKYFGTNIYAQSFIVAFRIPNMLRDMVGEGATDAAIVPVLTEYRHTRSNEEYWKAARVILNLIVVITAALALLGVIFAPVIVKMIAPGFVKDPEKLAETIFLARTLFPYLVFLGMVAYAKGVLNSMNVFAAPAFSTAVLNMAVIVSIVSLCGFIGINGVVIGVLVGGFLQVLLQMPQLYARGFSFRDGFALYHPVAARIGKLLLPRFVGTAVYQLSVLVDTILASLSWIVGAGGVAALEYAHRLFHLPLAIFGISLATAVLPRMSRESALGETERFKETIAFSLNTVFFVMIPASVGLMTLAQPVVRVLFQRGEFTSYSTAITSSALFYYAFGLFACAGIKILVSAFYSMNDTRTPVVTAAAALLVNIAANLALMWPLKVGGLALATSVAAMFNFFMLYVFLVKRVGDFGSRRVAAAFIRTLMAAAVMGAGIMAVRDNIFVSPLSAFDGLVRLFGVIAISALVYLALTLALRVEGAVKAVGFLVGMRTPHAGHREPASGRRTPNDF